MADNGELSRAQLPLQGVILCCTSIPPEKRSDLASIASRMGAIHKFDLTSDVTHLIVGDTDTPKYKFVAREREDVKCLLPSWIEAVRLSWLEGGETDVKALESQHMLPTFAGLRICVTGFDDLAHRRKLEDLINDNGGEYRGNLTKDVTHLIAKEPSGNKYNYAFQWNIKTVSIEWMQHSLERGMILDEPSYSLLLPPSERGRTAWIRRTVSTTFLGKRLREGELIRTNSRKLRRTASARLSSEDSGMWSNIVGEGVNQKQVRADERQDYNQKVHSVEVEGGSLSLLQTSGEQRFQKQDRCTVGSVHDPITLVPKGGIFEGKAFILNGFGERKRDVVQRHLESHGATILADVSSLPTTSEEGPSESHFLLVPHETSKGDLAALPEGLQRPTIVTEFWVERSLYNKQYISPIAHILDRPFFDTPIEGFNDLTISSTAFQDINLLHFSKVVPLIGAKFSEELSLETSVLVCYEFIQSSSKRQAAYECGIPAVTAEWLWDCIVQRKLLPYTAYLTQPLVARHQVIKSASQEPEMTSKERRCTTTVAEVERDGMVSSLTTVKPTDLPRSASTRIRHSSTNSCPRNSFSAETNMTVDKVSQKPIGEPNRNSSSTPRPQPAPLNEIPTNLSPKPPMQQPPKPNPTQEDPLSSLGPTISSLLAHHQRAASNVSERPQIGRRRRQLLGRAPSNLSNRSLSRASSVDTMNTDGLGTPLDASNQSARPSQMAVAKANSNFKDTKDPFATLRAYAEEAEKEENPQGAEVQMTQLGYEDPDVKAWRARVVRKMGGGNEIEDESLERRKRTIEVVKDVSLGTTKGVAGRTRAAGR